MKYFLPIIKGEEKESYRIPIDDDVTDNDIDWYLIDEDD